MSYAKLIAARDRLERKHTSNIFHLIMSIITVGLWIPIWIIVATNNAMERKKLIKVIEKEIRNEFEKGGNQHFIQ